MRKQVTTVLGAILIAAAGQAGAQSFSGSGYTAGELLSPCQESDNDARWGAAAEAECEQYLIGFADALHEVGLTGPGQKICLPAQNTADEIRWAFMRWVHRDYGARTKMSASAALLATLQESFPCAE